MLLFLLFLDLLPFSINSYTLLRTFIVIYLLDASCNTDWSGPWDILAIDTDNNIALS